ncbi:MAG: alcohol dehydrogenase catalytic domain-containing protein [Chloroflexi bacterium]|nr:alcohol dehydrogenase catalytic domain-containing protein [Chloroflexota bacterium]
MRAVMFQGTGRLEVAERPSQPLAADEVRLRVERSGICGSDIATWKGEWPSPVVPSIKGHEVCASVIEAGPAVEGLTPGQLVAVRPIRGCGGCRHCLQGRYSRCRSYQMYGQQMAGGWAEEMVVRHDHARPLAAHVTPDQGLFAEPIAVIAHAFNLAGGSLQGASVAILGAGVLGLLAIQIAFARGASRVFATGRQDKKLALARRFGASTADARTDDVVASGLEQGGPYDVVLDCIGSSEALNDAIRLSEYGGWVVLVAGPHHANLSLDYVEHRLRETAIVASRIYGADFDDCLELLAGGSLELAPLLTHRYAFEDGPAAMAFASSNRSDAIKVCLQPAGSF